VANIASRVTNLTGPLSTGRIALLIGLAALCLPSFVSLAQQTWSTEQGVHGPIVLATGLWLLYRAWPEVRALKAPGNIALACIVALPSFGLYAFARAFDFLSIEIAALGGVLIATFYAIYGAQATKRLWFPILYLFFLVPPPGWAIDLATASLKTFVSYASMVLLHFVGYPITRIGVTLYVAQYQLLVEDACSGMNSIVSLSAVSLFYIYLMHAASWRYALFLMGWILPIAILANIIRVIILVLLTYHMGNEAAQGFLHNTAGMVMFVTALLGIFGIDKVFSVFFFKDRKAVS
jgi:exosortase